jgi:asparagine synthetase B (glutamine-hydrolysing)
MCGIAGYIGKKRIEGPVIRQTLDLMKNRGPDHQDYRHIEQNGTLIYLLHSRLSIIDLGERATSHSRWMPSAHSSGAGSSI